MPFGHGTDLRSDGAFSGRMVWFGWQVGADRFPRSYLPFLLNSLWAMTSGEYGSTMVVEEAARACLDTLMGWVGVNGLVAAIRDPGLMATIDQHAAAVRDELGDGVTETRVLAEYARQVHAAAMAAGHRMPGPGRVDWAHARAYLLRLVAVCALAGTADRL